MDKPYTERLGGSYVADDKGKTRRVEWTTQADGGTIANLFEQVPRRGIRARQLWGAVQ